MSKKRPRRQLVGPSTRQNMYLLAGLPINTHKQAVASIKSRFTGAIVHSIPAITQDGALYGKSQVDTLLRSAGSFVIRRRTSDHEHPATPASITLLYVPSIDQEKLLATFDFAVLSAPLSKLATYNDRGQQLRHDKEEVNKAILDIIAPDSALDVARKKIAWRISRHMRSDEALLLPPRNFSVRESNLVPYFQQFRSGCRPWDDRLSELGPNELTHDDLPRRIARRETCRVFVDSRGMAFLMAHPRAFDGPLRELEDDAGPDEIARSLRALYRFGGALPRGMHHDVQRANGSPLGGTTFFCIEQGEHALKSDYTNIYPDDYVRSPR